MSGPRSKDSSNAAFERWASKISQRVMVSRDVIPQPNPNQHNFEAYLRLGRRIMAHPTEAHPVLRPE